MNIILEGSFLFVGLLFALILLYVGYLRVTYINKSFLVGTAYGSVIGETKPDVTERFRDLASKYPEIKIFVSYGERAGDNFTVEPARTVITDLGGRR